MRFALYCAFAIGLVYDAVAGIYLVHLWTEPRQNSAQAAKATLQASESAPKNVPAAAASRVYRLR